ncbi:hypothetical protein HRI_000219100 [Hibiscus trionum]|uniref:Uncharacterized protein n=1 Tax=Hibiscus trionum TaxID=183268 RepID=A0A9W7GVY8_HIBTR|nr:hypothetical protein HRI_000219100 [Hibiscus trionum]
MGVALCCIFVNDDASRDENIGYKAVIHCRNSGQAACDESVFLDGYDRGVDESGFFLGKEYNQTIKKDHLFLRYWPRDILYPFSLEDKCGASETKNLSTSDYSNQECDELELSSRSGPSDNFVKVMKCGVQIMYEKDLEDIQLIKEQHRNQICTKIEEMNEDSAADESIANGALGKRKCDIYEGMEAVPQPKGMEKLFAFLMGRAGKKH